MSTLSSRTPSNAAAETTTRPVGQGRIREAQARVATLTRKLREARGSRSRGADVEKLQAELTAAERDVSRLRRQAVTAQRDAGKEQRSRSFVFDREHPAMELPPEILDQLIQPVEPVTAPAAPELQASNDEQDTAEDDTSFSLDEADSPAPGGEKIVMVYRGHASEARDLKGASVDFGPLLTDTPAPGKEAPAARKAATPPTADTPSTTRSAPAGTATEPARPQAPAPAAASPGKELDFGPLVADTPAPGKEAPAARKATASAPTASTARPAPAVTATEPAPPQAPAPAAADPDNELDFGPLVEEDIKEQPEQAPAPPAPAKKTGPATTARNADRGGRKPAPAPAPAQAAPAAPAADRPQAPSVTPPPASLPEDLPGSRSTARAAGTTGARDRRQEVEGSSGMGRKLGLMAGALLGLGITIYALELVGWGSGSTPPEDTAATAQQVPAAPAPAAMERAEKFEASRTAREQAVRDAARQRFEALRSAAQEPPSRTTAVATPPPAAASTGPLPDATPITGGAETAPTAAAADTLPPPPLPEGPGVGPVAPLPESWGNEVEAGIEPAVEWSEPAATIGTPVVAADAPEAPVTEPMALDDPALHEEDPPEEIGQLPSESSLFPAPAASPSTELSTETPVPAAPAAEEAAGVSAEDGSMDIGVSSGDDSAAAGSSSGADVGAADSGDGL